MQLTETYEWFEKEFCGRYDVNLKSKTGMLEDWKEALLIFSKEIATEAVRSLYANSTSKPSINEFKKTAFEIARSKNQQIVEKNEMIYSPLFVQLVRTTKDCRLNCAGMFEQIRYLSSQNPATHQVSEAAENLKVKLEKVYGGDWQIIDFTGMDGTGIDFYRNMRDKQRALQRQLN